jgi:hypothetical protein
VASQISTLDMENERGNIPPAEAEANPYKQLNIHANRLDSH